jgi:hypothetical protein
LEAAGDGGIGAERYDHAGFARLAHAARGEVFVKQQGGSLGAGGHLNGAEVTPTIARPLVKVGNTSRKRSAPAKE